MTQEENILKAIIEKESWEEILYYVVSIENINPWDIDLVKLVDGFIKFLNKVKKLDFRIPAKIVFVASILLKLKARQLDLFEEERRKRIQKILREVEELSIDPNLIELAYPVKRVVRRPITLDELISAIKSLMELKKKKEKRFFEIERIQNRIELPEEDISQRIEKIYREIDEIVKREKRRKINFKEIVKEWKREEIVRKFVPLLHLEQNRKITTEQEEFFKDLWIRVESNE